jgi:glutaredoxin-related protein
MSEGSTPMQIEFPVYKGLSQRERYIQEFIWMRDRYYWTTPIPNMIWHYTRFETLQKILAEKSLLLTHVSKMNDENELAVSSNAVEMILKSRLETPGLTPRKQTLFSEALKQLNFDATQSPYFVFSTSEAEDNASQWFRYGGEEAGVSLGFDPKELLAFLGYPPYDYPLLHPIIYDSAATTKFFSFLMVLGESNFDHDYSEIVDDMKAVEQFLGEWGQHADFLDGKTKESGDLPNPNL